MIINKFNDGINCCVNFASLSKIAMIWFLFVMDISNIHINKNVVRPCQNDFKRDIICGKKL